MRPIHIENAKAAVDSLCANCEEDEERNYGELIANEVNPDDYSSGHKDIRDAHSAMILKGALAKDIPTSKLLDSNYKDLRVLKDFFNCYITTIHQVLIGAVDREKYEGNSDYQEKVKDILWGYISEKDIPEITLKLKNLEGK